MTELEAIQLEIYKEELRKKQIENAHAAELARRDGVTIPPRDGTNNTLVLTDTYIMKEEEPLPAVVVEPHHQSLDKSAPHHGLAKAAFS